MSKKFCQRNSIDGKIDQFMIPKGTVNLLNEHEKSKRIVGFPNSAHKTQSKLMFENAFHKNKDKKNQSDLKNNDIYAKIDSKLTIPNKKYPKFECEELLPNEVLQFKNTRKRDLNVAPKISKDLLFDAECPLGFDPLLNQVSNISNFANPLKRTKEPIMETNTTQTSFKNSSAQNHTKKPVKYSQYFSGVKLNDDGCLPSDEEEQKPETHNLKKRPLLLHELQFEFDNSSPNKSKKIKTNSLKKDIFDELFQTDNQTYSRPTNKPNAPSLAEFEAFAPESGKSFLNYMNKIFSKPFHLEINNYNFKEFCLPVEFQSIRDYRDKLKVLLIEEVKANFINTLKSEDYAKSAFIKSTFETSYRNTENNIDFGFIVKTVSIFKSDSFAVEKSY